MSDKSEPECRYFRSVFGQVVRRFGSTSYIGVKRAPGGGWEWNTDDVVRIPLTELRRYTREYRRVINDGALIEVAQGDFDRIHSTNQTKPVKTSGKKGKKKSQAAADEEG